MGVEFWPPICLVFLFFFFASSFITFLPLLTLFIFFLHLIFLLQLTISSLKKKSFSKLLNLPSLVSLNIFLDPCVLEHFCHTPIFGETHFQTHLFFAPTCILPMDFLFLLFMARNMIQHLIGMIRRGSFKTHAPYSHMDIKVNFFFGYFVWKNVVSCFIESFLSFCCVLLEFGALYD